MMLSASPSMIVRSSLEEMLESLRQRDEVEKPKDLPPALPSRPPSKARRPSAKHALPSSFKVGNGEPESLPSPAPKVEPKRKIGFRMSSFGRKKKKEQSLGSPYDSETSKSNPSDALPEQEWEDVISYFTNKKLRLWYRVGGERWESGIIQSNSGEKVYVSPSNGTIVEMSKGELFPANPSILDGVDDLIQLCYLNEPSVLHNLQYRYSRDMIYSKAGPILIAVNPFKDVKIYGNDILMAYRQQLRDSPHVYAITDAAYSQMMRDEGNQSIITSGESGSGKTETAKMAMQYLAALGGDSSGIADEILQTSCILEAFGNAKTSINNNSSRFGKSIDFHFSTTGKILGASIQTFLLEKSRVVQLAYGERSYHIFYQLCAGAPTALKESLNLKAANKYNYLNQSNCLTIDGVDDAQQFHRLMEALNTVRICKEDQEQAFAMVAAVLWLGNISFQAINSENHVEVVMDEAVTSASRLMGCSPQDLLTALSTQRIQSGDKTITKMLTLQQAVQTRDALAKFIYAGLFDWFVVQINKLFEVCEQCSGRSISILDIYGFESFPRNSFEQFCINYANERLQQHFNRHLLKLEQEEYELEGIDWTKVEFEDNQECLGLIEKKSTGLLSLLDEESKFPKASDLTLASKLKQHLSSNPCFKAERDGAFTICHHAAEVMYDTCGFLEKNRDPLQSVSIQLLSSCSKKLPQLFASNTLNQTGALDSKKQSIVENFKSQIFKLMMQLENTTPHFIRCIKPNDKKLPGLYQSDLVLQQLRCCGVLEVVRITRCGYPNRMTHQEFAGRYGFLVSSENVSQDPLSASVAVLQQFNVLPEMYQIGYTKLYLRTRLFSELEDRRKHVMRGVVGFQSCFRGYQARCTFDELKKGVTALQSYVRGETARQEYDALVKMHQTSLPKTANQNEAVICLQSAIRGWLVRKQFHSEHSLKSNHKNRKYIQPEWKASDTKDIPPEQVHKVMEELRSRVANTEAVVRQKSEENVALKEQLQLYEKKWLEYEGKMKLMEEKWQKQISSLQGSLSAARKSLTASNAVAPSGQYEGSSDATNSGSRSPAGNALARYFNDAGAARENGHAHPVNTLAKEFERQKLTFDDEVRTLNEAKSPLNSASHMPHPVDDLKKLKSRFELWKKDFKGRLREAKARQHRHGIADAEKWRTWWPKKIRA